MSEQESTISPELKKKNAERLLNEATEWEDTKSPENEESMSMSSEQQEAFNQGMKLAAIAKDKEFMEYFKKGVEKYEENTTKSEPEDEDDMSYTKEGVKITPELDNKIDGMINNSAEFLE